MPSTHHSVAGSIVGNHCARTEKREEKWSCIIVKTVLTLRASERFWGPGALILAGELQFCSTCHADDRAGSTWPAVERTE